MVVLPRPHVVRALAGAPEILVMVLPLAFVVGREICREMIASCPFVPPRRDLSLQGTFWEDMSAPRAHRLFVTFSSFAFDEVLSSRHLASIFSKTIPPVSRPLRNSRSRAVSDYDCWQRVSLFSLSFVLCPFVDIVLCSRYRKATSSTKRARAGDTHLPKRIRVVAPNPSSRSNAPSGSMAPPPVPSTATAAGAATQPPEYQTQGNAQTTGNPPVPGATEGANANANADPKGKGKEKSKDKGKKGKGKKKGKAENEEPTAVPSTSYHVRMKNWPAGSGGTKVSCI